MEIAREKGEQRRNEEAQAAKEKAKRGGKLSHYEVANLEATLAAATDPDSVKMPPGYEVKPD